MELISLEDGLGLKLPNIPGSLKFDKCMLKGRVASLDDLEKDRRYIASVLKINDSNLDFVGVKGGKYLDYIGIGVFKDRVGNIIVLVDELYWEQFKRSGLVGRFVEVREFVRGVSGLGCRYVGRFWRERWIRDRWDSNSRFDSEVRKIREWVDRVSGGKRVNKIFVYTWRCEDGIISCCSSVLDDLASLLIVGVSAVLGVPEVGVVLARKVRKLIRKIQDGESITLVEVADLVEPFLPEVVKVSNYYRVAKQIMPAIEFSRSGVDLKFDNKLLKGYMREKVVDILNVVGLPGRLWNAERSGYLEMLAGRYGRGLVGAQEAGVVNDVIKTGNNGVQTNFFGGQDFMRIMIDYVGVSAEGYKGLRDYMFGIPPEFLWNEYEEHVILSEAERARRKGKKYELPMYMDKLRRECMERRLREEGLWGKSDKQRSVKMVVRKGKGDKYMREGKGVRIVGFLAVIGMLSKLLEQSGTKTS